MNIISVVVPVFNVEKYIRRCIESIQKQTIKDIEIIVVDDSTPDNSIEIVEEMAKADDRIRIIRHERNMGLMWARRTGYMAANGEFIGFCDSDDYLPINALELLYNEALSSGADVVSGNLTLIKSNGEQEQLRSILRYGNDKINAFKSLLRGELRHNLCSKLFKASILKNYTYKTYENFTNGEDGCLFYQIVENINKIIHIDVPVYYYMQNEESSTNVRLKENAIRSICILNWTRHEVMSKYSELETDLQKSITNILCFLYEQGYDKDAKLDYYINEYGLSDYVTLSSIIKYCKWPNLVRLIIRRALLLIK